MTILNCGESAPLLLGCSSLSEPACRVSVYSSLISYISSALVNSFTPAPQHPEQHSFAQWQPSTGEGSVSLTSYVSRALALGSEAALQELSVFTDSNSSLWFSLTHLKKISLKLLLSRWIQVFTWLSFQTAPDGPISTCGPLTCCLPLC